MQLRLSLRFKAQRAISSARPPTVRGRTRPPTWPCAPAPLINIIGAVISGLVVGALARRFYPGAVDMGWLATIGLGIGGSLLAGLITSRGNR